MPRTTQKSRTADTNTLVEVIHDDDLVPKGEQGWPKDRLKDELKGKKNADGKTIVTAFYLGISMDLRGPAFMRHQTPKAPKGQTPIPGRVREQIPRNNLKGLIIRSEPATTITGQAVIPHYLMTVKENLLAAKRLVSGVPP
ncbi:hypothetical protein J3F84DRAFT_403367 [Trichoderma pleuroticola]